MKRGYTALEYRSIARRLQQARAGISLSSDFIVGFPGETDGDFEATLKLAGDIGFDASFSFLYSPRPGTPAAELPDPTPRDVKLQRLRGSLDENLRQIESALDVTIARRGSKFTVRGDQAQRAAQAIEHFYDRASGELTLDDVQLALTEVLQGNRPAPEAGPQLLTRRQDLHGRTPHQIEYIEKILAHDCTIGIGPAGTGKTYLAVACAVDALERDKVKRIVLVRPAGEAGARLGFLPGDLAQKVEPYLRPRYDAANDLMGFDKTRT